MTLHINFLFQFFFYSYTKKVDLVLRHLKKKTKRKKTLQNWLLCYKTVRHVYLFSNVRDILFLLVLKNVSMKIEANKKHTKGDYTTEV